MPFSAGAVLAFTAAAFFSLKAIFVKLAYIYHVDAVTLLALRMLLCLPVLLASAWWSSRAHPHRMTRKDWLAVLFLGAVGYYLSSLLDFVGLAYITAGLERLILFLYPTIVAVISVFLFKKPIGRTGIVALVLSYIGIAVATVETVNTTGDVHAVIMGSALIFACTITYAIYIAGSGEVVGRIGATRFAALATLVAAVCVLVQFAIENPAHALVTQPWQVYMHAGGMALISTLLPIFMTSKAIQMIGAAKVSMIGAVGPVATIFFGWLFLSEDVTVLQMVGAALVLAGVILVARKPAPKPTPAEAAETRGEALAAAATGD
ncbi:MAG TPA: DMT family transporter [Dongiaceae bacterium]|nr:DMT family transporter [Dongiaceae bacterium]